MRRRSFWIAASCILAVIGLRPVLSSSAAPASKEKVLYAFTGGADGGQPMSDLTLDAAGNLYGTTSVGGTGTACGSSGCGTVFELQRTKDGWKEQVLYSFAGGTDGIGPEAGVIFDGAGNFYGTTAGGGVGGAGTVFKLAPNSHGGWTESVLFSFPYDWSAGYAPRADLAFDAHGNLFGTASGGGTSNKGVCHDNVRHGIRTNAPVRWLLDGNNHLWIWRGSRRCNAVLRCASRFQPSLRNNFLRWRRSLQCRWQSVASEPRVRDCLYAHAQLGGKLDRERAL